MLSDPNRTTVSLVRPTHANPKDPLPIVEPPALAPNVRLLGKFSAPGFNDQQWLVQRDGRYIQMTDLLYRVAEQIDGKRSVEEIAANITDCSEWIVTGEDVYHMITTKLIPLGLIAATEYDAKTDRSKPSPLGVNLQLRTISPPVIEAVTQYLQMLCHPALVILFVIAAVSGHWWLYRVHGVKAALQDAMYTPGGLFFVLVLVCAAALFHEFGHASALRRQGGVVGGMGVGLYIIYPAFYTDVTDSYRLSRWSRVAVDLGGIYFHLIVTTAIIAAYRATGRELLLFTVLLIDLEILWQFIPIVRLDGYWLLADFTGIPDFFSQMLPFLRSVAPDAAKLDGDKLPQLKPGVRLAFAAYLLIAVPLLAYLFATMVLDLPALIHTTWNSLHLQVHTLATIGIWTSPLISILVVLQIVFLGLPIVATVYLLWVVAVSPLNSFVNWISGSWRNPLLALAGIIACSCLLAAVNTLLRHHLHHAQSPTESSLAIARAATTQLQSLTADIDGWLGPDHFTGTLILRRPNLARIQITGTKAMGKFLVVSDGKKVITYFSDDNQYVQTNPGNYGQNIQAQVAEQVGEFFQPTSIGLNVRQEDIRVQNRDREWETLEVKLNQEEHEITRYQISTKDNLIYGVSILDGETNKQISSSRLSNVHTNASIDPAVFQWAPPPTAKPLPFPGGMSLPLR
jgi:outer membrane lipoprotein-sorting protein